MEIILTDMFGYVYFIFVMINMRNSYGVHCQNAHVEYTGKYSKLRGTVNCI